MMLKLKKYTSSSFLKGVVVMVMGTAGAQVITLLLSPIITRIYGPDAFGVLGTFVALINIIAPIAALTYPIAVVLPKEEDEALGVVRLSLRITLIITILSLIILFFFRNYLINIFNLEEISSYLFLIPLVILFSGIMQISEQWLIRTKQFAINAKVNFLQSIIINVSKVGIGLFNPVASVLVILQVISNGLKAFMMIVFSGSFRKIRFSTVVKSNLSLIKPLKKYKDFPLFRAPEVLLSAFSQNLPVLLLTAFFGPASAGFYTIGRSVLSLPSRLIGKAVGDVFYPHITEAANRNENITRLIARATIALIIVGIIPFGVIILFGPSLFKFIFGTSWEYAGEYARWISLLSFSIFINRPSIRSLPVLNAQGFLLAYTVIILVVQSISLVIGFYIFNSDLVAVALFGITGLILNIILIILTIKKSRKL